MCLCSAYVAAGPPGLVCSRRACHQLPPSRWAGVSPPGGGPLIGGSRSGVGIGGKANLASTSWMFPNLPCIFHCLGQSSYTFHSDHELNHETSKGQGVKVNGLLGCSWLSSLLSMEEHFSQELQKMVFQTISITKITERTQLVESYTWQSSL